MSEYCGCWFYSLRYDEIIQAKDRVHEYCLLNCPQEYDGPFSTENEVKAYRLAHPDLHQKFLQTIQEMEEFYYG